MKKQKTVLVVEDEKSLRDILVDSLRIKDFLPLEANNGKEGIEVALSEHPDLILLDLLMPVIDGMTALKKIREDAWGAHVPVIILTNLSATSEALVEGMVAYRPMYYLVKSDWKINDIMAKIKELLETKN